MKKVGEKIPEKDKKMVEIVFKTGTMPQKGRTYKNNNDNVFACVKANDGSQVKCIF